MKRKGLTLIICMMLVFTFLFTACGGGGNSGGDVDLSSSKYVGTWKASHVALKDDTEALDALWTLTLNGDGTGTYVDEESTSNITWELTSNGFKTKGDTKLTFTDDGDNIKTKIIGVDVVFVKQ